jgi:hypothetical protein
MRAALLFLALAVIALLVILGVLAARRLARHMREVREMARYWRLVIHLSDLASQHAELGDPFAVIVADEIRKTINPPKGLR